MWLDLGGTLIRDIFPLRPCDVAWCWRSKCSQCSHFGQRHGLCDLIRLCHGQRSLLGSVSLCLFTLTGKFLAPWGAPMAPVANEG